MTQNLLFFCLLLLLLSPPPPPPSFSSVDSKLIFISHPETYSRTLVNYWFLIFGGSTSIYSFKLNSYLAPWVKLRYLLNFSFIWNLISAHIPSLSHGKQVPNNSFLRAEYWVWVFFFLEGEDWLSALCFGLICVNCFKVRENEMTHALPFWWGETHLEASREQGSLRGVCGTMCGLYIYGHHKALAAVIGRC